MASRWFAEHSQTRSRLGLLGGGRERPSRLAPGGLAAWLQVIQRGYESYVAKDEASAYEGGTTRRWLKGKQKDWTVGDERWTRRISVSR